MRGLVYDYRLKRALDNLSFTVEAGSVTALVGPNGAGKSTLLRCLAGLEEPLAGTIVIDGVNVLENPHAAHMKLGFLQDVFGVYENLTVRQSVYHAAAVMGLGEDRIDEAVLKAIHSVSLDKYAKFRANQLSRGLRQRLAIARTIVHGPKLLLLDEPASGLDPDARRELSTLIKSLQAAGTTLAVSSHILTELEEYSTHMLAMRDGQLRGPMPIGAAKMGDIRRIQATILQGAVDAGWLLGTLPGVANVKSDGAVFTFDLAGGDDAQAETLRRLVHEGARVTQFQALQENLEQLYFAEPLS